MYIFHVSVVKVNIVGTIAVSASIGTGFDLFFGGVDH
jgi:hypothetical protein